MTLTVGSGPLAGRPEGRRNFAIDAPAHRLLLEDYPHRLRAVVGGRVVLDSTRASVLHETGHQIVPYVPLEDFDRAVLRRSDTVTHCPFKGDASYWSLRVGGHELDDAVWAYEQPLASAAWLAGLAALRWDKADAWFVEDEVAFGPHLRDPYHRVDVFEASRPVTVHAGEHLIARTTRPKLLFETSLPVRVYVPRADVLAGALVPSQKRTQCPYKGQATYFSVQLDGRRIDDAAWTYETPLPEAHKVTGDVCFVAEGIDVDVGEPTDRRTA
ncbi:MAG TPA: DUF427 domain-containing protein [Solirubrobacteraceae bacterium]|nr:DUF427 domain-containing protein [Solirubrobacteraceae bacterium]